MSPSKLTSLQLAALAHDAIRRGLVLDTPALWAVTRLVR